MSDGIDCVTDLRTYYPHFYLTWPPVMDKLLPKILWESMHSIISSQELSSWTIHNGHNTVLTLRFKNLCPGGTPQIPDNSGATFHRSSNSRITRDHNPAQKKKMENISDHFLRSKIKNNTELQRKASDSDMISSLSPDAVEFVPIPH